ncbi:MAG: HAD family hydrolase [Lachnospiraceae bacterium]|jgi:HAD superfamily hydrolase (TIGR01549 family)
MKKAIFWDFDGTLVYSEHMWSNCMYRILKRYWPDTPLRIEDLRSTGIVLYTWDEPEKDNRKLVGDAWWAYTEERFWQAYRLAGVPQEIALRASQDMRSEILKVENYRLYQDACDTLSACREKGYENYLLSNNYPELEVIVKELGLMPYFDGLVISAVVGYDKPREEFFRIGLEMAGYPSVCYMVGDNLRADIAGGNQMSMTTILVHRKETGQENYCFSDLSFIPDILV